MNTRKTRKCCQQIIQNKTYFSALIEVWLAGEIVWHPGVWALQQHIPGFMLLLGRQATICVQIDARLTVVFEHPDSRSWQSGPQDERCVIELITQYQTTLENNGGEIISSRFLCQSRITCSCSFRRMFDYGGWRAWIESVGCVYT